jgi:hypothetical protein
MKFTIDIDTGGTFTEGYIYGDGRIERVKVRMTQMDETVKTIGGGVLDVDGR